MKPFCIFTAVFLLAGVCSVTAQDLIVLKNGNMIEAKVIEISPTEIRYKRFDNLEGPTIVILATDVLSIRYENGTTEIINANTVTEQENIQADKSGIYRINPEKLNFGIFIEPSGFLLYGPSLSAEFIKGGFNTQINFTFPSLGLIFEGDNFAFGIGLSLNYFHHSRIGGFYLGGLIEFNTWNGLHGGVAAMNIGYIYVLSSGIYFRTGLNLGARWPLGAYLNFPSFLIRPILSFGYNF